MRATIIGLGMIGGSIGRRLLDQGWEIGFLDPGVTLDEARRAYAARHKYEDLEAIPPEDLIVLATPVDVALRLITKNHFPNLVTTVCSVMSPFRLLGERTGNQIVAGHPFAGSQESGVAAAKIDLFAGQRWFLEQSTPSEAVERLISACGATMIAVDSEEHDRAVAFTSHLPQLLSTALAAVIARNEIDVERFAGSGLRTFLRLAGSEQSVWRPIFEANAAALEEATSDFIESVESMLTGNDLEHFRQANALWSRL